MKKLLIILMPITIILAIISVITEKDHSYIEFLEGISRLNFENFPTENIEKALNSINFENIWVGIWDNINNIGDWFGALGNSLKAIGESVGQIGNMIWAVIKFIFEIIGWLWNIIVELITFINKYLGLST